MTADRRREEKSETEMEKTRRNLNKTPQGAMADKATKEPSYLPDNDRNRYVAKIENIVSSQNMMEAYKAVKRNKGAPGIDGITVEEIDDYIEKEWPKIRDNILEGKYVPKPVRREELKKQDGGVRQLGIPTVMDRIIQQAIYQELRPVFDPIFSQYSYGFRPGKSAQQAVLQAQAFILEGCEWVVDIDLEKFFDRINHDMLMARVARQVKDKKILLLIRRYLESGVMANGVVLETEEGAPQGGPLSPLLSNIMLDDLDKELEKRGLRFARYADDCNIYVKSEKAGKRVMESIVKFLYERLKLKVNQSKSAVDRPGNRKFLGFTFTQGKEPNRIKVHESRTKRIRDKIKEITKRMKSSKLTDSIPKLLLPVTRGWANYFKIAEEHYAFMNLDGWIRRKIRALYWKQWKTAKGRLKNLRRLGVRNGEAKSTAYSTKGAWRMSHTKSVQKALSNKVIESLGYVPMMKTVLAGS